MKKFISKNPKETKKIAGKLLKNLTGGEILGLIGNLGSGKTLFVQGLAEAMGIKEVVNSPTFVLMKIYKIRDSRLVIRELVHLDAYRLNLFAQLKEIGVEEYLNKKNCLMVVEWADKVKEIKKYPKYQEIIFEEGNNVNERIIKIKD